MDWTDQCAGASWGYWTPTCRPCPVPSTPSSRPTAATSTSRTCCWTGAPTLVTSPQHGGHLQDQPQGGLERWRAHHVDRLQVHVGPHRQRHRTSTTPTGYTNIASVDDSDPSTAVVTFSKPYAVWKGLFGGGYGILPSHILKGKDQDALMKDGYTWSGGPYMMTVVGRRARRSRWSRTRSGTGRTSRTSTRSSSSWCTDTVDRVPGVQVGPGQDDLPAAPDRRGQPDRRRHPRCQLEVQRPTPAPSRSSG